MLQLTLVSEGFKVDAHRHIPDARQLPIIMRKERYTFSFFATTFNDTPSRGGVHMLLEAEDGYANYTIYSVLRNLVPCFSWT